MRLHPRACDEAAQSGFRLLQVLENFLQSQGDPSNMSAVFVVLRFAVLPSGSCNLLSFHVGKTNAPSNGSSKGDMKSVHTAPTF
jgi:hypothetical protein